MGCCADPPCVFSTSLYWIFFVEPYRNIPSDVMDSIGIHSSMFPFSISEEIFSIALGFYQTFSYGAILSYIFMASIAWA